MNQHDEQQGDAQGSASPAGAEPAAADVRVDETHAGPVEPQVDRIELPAPAATGDGPLDPSEQAAGGDAPGPPAGAAPSTGDDRVDEALTRLAELDRLDVTEHAGVVEDVHRALQDTLAEEVD